MAKEGEVMMRRPESLTELWKAMRGELMEAHEHEWEKDGSGKSYFCTKGCGAELSIDELMSENVSLREQLAEAQADILVHRQRAIEVIAKQNDELKEAQEQVVELERVLKYTGESRDAHSAGWTNCVIELGEAKEKLKNALQKKG